MNEENKKRINDIIKRIGNRLMFKDLVNYAKKSLSNIKAIPK